MTDESRPPPPPDIVEDPKAPASSPTPERGFSLIKDQYDAQLEDWKARQRDPVEAAVAKQGQTWKERDAATAVLEARRDADRAADVASRTAVLGAYLQVAQGSLDRAAKRAEFLVTIEGAIAGLYTGVLGLVFGKEAFAKDPGAVALPLIALAPVAFLGAALVLSSVYMSFLRRKTINVALLPDGSGGNIDEMRLRTFMEWTFASVLNRAWALRSSVVGLGLAVFLLPIPFISALGNKGGLGWIVVFASGLYVVWLIGEFFALKPHLGLSFGARGNGETDDGSGGVEVPPTLGPSGPISNPTQ